MPWTSQSGTNFPPLLGKPPSNKRYSATEPLSSQPISAVPFPQNGKNSEARPNNACQYLPEQVNLRNFCLMIYYRLASLWKEKPVSFIWRDFLYFWLWRFYILSCAPGRRVGISIFGITNQSAPSREAEKIAYFQTRRSLFGRANANKI